MQKKIFLVFLFAAVVGGLTTLICGIAHELDHAQTAVLSVLPVTVYFQATIPDAQSRSVSEGLKARDTAIESLSYISKEQAYAEASKDPLLSRSLMLLHDNPLSAVVKIYYSKRAWLERQDPAQALHELPGVQDIRWNPARRDVFLSFEHWQKIISQSLWAISLLLLVWSLAGIYSILLARALRKHVLLFLFTGILGAAVTLAAWPLVLPSQAYPLLPVLFGALVGIGSFSESRV